MLDKFGRTLLFLFFAVLFFTGFKMAVRVADPYTRRMSPSLADALKAA